MYLKKTAFLLATLIIIALFSLEIQAQSVSGKPEKPSTLFLEEELLEYSTPIVRLRLVSSSQTVFGLESAETGFDYTPSDRLENRSADGFYHLGDINLRLRPEEEDEWTSYSSATRRKPVKNIRPDDASVLAASILDNTFPPDFPLGVIRYWQQKDDHLILRFDLKNRSNKSIEIGALGIPLIFNNNIDGKTLEQAHAENVFFDPYIGRDAGYLQVVRLDGEGPVLLVLPWEKSPFEGYRPLLDDPTRRGITFEGFHEWMIHSKAYAENEWKGVEQWNHPTSRILEPEEIYSVGLEFVLSESLRNIETTLVKQDRPVALGIPGYILPMDVKGQLFLRTKRQVKKITVEPEGALDIKPEPDPSSIWEKYSVAGIKWGRARLTLIYDDGTEQTIHYKVVKPETEIVADNGRFLMEKQWYENDQDLFGRSPSVMTYDYEAGNQVTQDSRAWIAGLSDEGGAGSWLNAIMKQLVMPDPDEIAKLETFVNKTIWGKIQYNEGDLKYGVRKSLFYYEPDSFPAGTYSDSMNYETWAAWPKEEAESVGRSYNYPHVTAAYWVMYRLARNYQSLVTQRDWAWYLENSYHTAMAMIDLAPYYAQFGQMEGTVFLLLLNDLKAEGFTSLADQLEEAMRKRALHWNSLQFPFGSEMPWDSTGQEEVYMWSDYFGFSEKTLVTVNAILAYMPTVPHWAYNGNARRYWDFLYGGKRQGIERMIHHYGSALNAIPVLKEYRYHPGDLYLLRVGYGGLMGALSNITTDGFAPCAFHSFPSILENDGISGDYGSGFLGYAVNTATFITKDKEFGWLAFGGNLITKKQWIETKITTASASRVFIAPAGIWLTLDAGRFQQVNYNPFTGAVQAILAPGNSFTPRALLRVEGVSISEQLNKQYKKNNRDAYEIPLGSKVVKIEIIKPGKKETR